MNYRKHYNKLIAKYGNQNKPDYPSERHHVIPGCEGGSDDVSNLLYLSYRQHFIAHRLLAKIYPTSKGLNLAVWRMSEGNKNWGYRVTGKTHAILREKASKLNADTGKKQYINKTGMFAKSAQFVKDNAKRAGNICLEKRTGIHSLSVEQRLIAASLGGKKAAELKVGLSDPRVIAETSKRTTARNFVKYRCESCGMEANLGNIAYHQKVSGHIGRSNAV